MHRTVPAFTYTKKKKSFTKKTKKNRSISPSTEHEFHELGHKIQVNLVARNHQKYP